MSEPDAGSDLAISQSRAVKESNGWRLHGTKVWTTNAHICDWMIVLCRTSEASDKRQGLSQMLVNMTTPGITVQPIPFLDGTLDFNEVVFDDVWLPEESLLGGEGEGWSQVNSELAFERAGPERWLSPLLVVEQFLRDYRGQLPTGAKELLGEIIGRWWAIRRASIGSRAID